eukprot:scaffold1390_cov138-Cylindrotheca_fusiformis.AAC.7
MMCATNDNKQKNTASSYTREDRRELVSMARNLRRMKRQMLLKAVEKPEDPVEGLRTLITRAVVETDSNDGSVGSVSMTPSIEKPGDVLRTQPSRSIKGSVSCIHMAPQAA